MISDQADAAKVIVASFGCLGDKVLHGKGGVNVDSNIFSRVSDWNGCVA